MFRRLPSSLPPDPVAPQSLRELGYFVTDHDQIRKIVNPQEKYQFRINRSDRVNEVYKEAMNGCIRRIVIERLESLGLERVRLPLGSSAMEAHVPIYVSRDLRHKKRVLVLFGERNQDLGVLSYRTVSEEGIQAGSAVGIADAVTRFSLTDSGADVQGIVLTNPGQLLWYRGGQRAVSDREWRNLPRETAVHESFGIDSVKNRAPGNADFVQHVQYIFEHVLRENTAEQTQLDIIALEYTGSAVLQYLATHWSEWKARISGISICSPQYRISELGTQIEDEAGLQSFMAKRMRAYLVSDRPIETPLPGREIFGCNCYSGGEPFYEECVLVRSWRRMLDWFDMISAIETYEEPNFQSIGEDQGDENR